MCRVIAPLAAMFFREVTSRLRRFISPLQRQLRIIRHRALRWFGEPIAIIERKRSKRGLDASVWRYDFRSRPARHYARLEHAAKRVA
jgi:hypothetical protein